MSDILKRLTAQKKAKEEEEAKSKPIEKKEPPKKEPQKPPSSATCTACDVEFFYTDLTKYRKKLYCDNCLEEVKETARQKQQPKITPELIKELIPKLSPNLIKDLIPKLITEIIPLIKAELPVESTPTPVSFTQLDFKKMLEKIDQLYEEFLADGSHAEWRQIFKRLYYNYRKREWRAVGDRQRMHDADLWLRFFNMYWTEITSN